ncbi:SDR family NAD(P)-dependent oxidoreductase [Candidatus Micrarchaeota archaeon]|nr:SDR family NAD(P)-dependent oxidoreductase [Candidatus Micrarchaeota archaeon]
MYLKILVTGGAGFIGSHLVDRLVERGDEVVVYDNFSPYYSGKEKNIQKHVDGKNKNFQLVRADILDFEKLCASIKGCDAVVHLAAQPGVRYSLENASEVAKINVDGTVNVLEACVKSTVKKLVFGSSSSVYGDVEKLPAREEYACNPISPYGASKLAGEKFCECYSRMFGLQIPILRFFTVYGPRQRPDMGIHKFVKAVMDGGEITVFGGGKQTRDFTFVSDIVEGVSSAVDKKVETTPINLGGGNNISVNELVKAIEEACGKKAKIKNVEWQKGDVKDTLASNEKAGKLLVWKPRVKIHDGLKEYVKWRQFSSA